MLRPFHDILPEGKDTPPPAVRRIALVIGNGRYTAEKDVLDNPPNDAKAIAKALTRIGFYGVKPNGDDFAVNFAAPGVPALIDLDQKRLGRALAALERAAPGVSQAVIYYAGHGIEVSGENYLIPIDAKLAHDTDAKYETQPLRRAPRPSTEPPACASSFSTRAAIIRFEPDYFATGATAAASEALNRPAIFW